MSLVPCGNYLNNTVFRRKSLDLCTSGCSYSCHAKTGHIYVLFTAASLSISLDFILTVLPSDRTLIMGIRDMKSPKRRQTTDVKPPESELRPTSETKERGKKDQKSDHFDQ